MAKTAEVDKLKEERERIRQRHVQMIQPDRQQESDLYIFSSRQKLFTEFLKKYCRFTENITGRLLIPQSLLISSTTKSKN